MADLRRARLAVCGCLVAAWLLCSAVPAMASTYTVTNADSSGLGSLAQAVNSANGDPSTPTTIAFEPGVSGVIDLLGPLTVTRSVTIEGPGASKLEVDGDGGQVQLMTVSASSTVSISGLELAYGTASMGGAINNAGTLTISGSLVDHNTAQDNSVEGEGGAIYNTGTLTVTDSTFSGNAAGGTGGSGHFSGAGIGGAIFNGPSGSLSVSGSTFTGNGAGGAGGDGPVSGAGAGGAISSQSDAVLSVTDSTFTANTAGGAAGSGFDSGQGLGGAIASDGTATLEGDTIDANAVGSGAGTGGAGFNNGGSASVKGTIVSANTGSGNCANAGTISASDSLEGPAGQTSCGFDLPSADPDLGLLADNGGPTETQALGAGSPAIDAVSSATDCASVDQRGVARPAGGACDVGAYEVALPVLGASSATSGPNSAAVNASVANPDLEAGTVSVQYGTSTSYGSSAAPQTLPAQSPASAYTAAVSGLQPGTSYHFRTVAVNPDGTTYGPDQTFTTSTFPSPFRREATPANAFTFGRVSVSPAGRITVPVNAPDAGRFTAKATFIVRSTVTRRVHGKRVLRHVTSTYTYGTASVSSTGKGTFKLVFGLSARAAQELKLLGSRQVGISVMFTPTGGNARTKTDELTIKRSRRGKYS